MIAATLLFLVTAADDPIFQALSDELARSTSRLKIAPAEPPYYLAYTVRDTENYQVSASFGADTGEGGGRYRSFLADTRVGNYSLDNTNFADEGGGSHFDVSSVPVDGDYAAIRRAVWLATDRSYKRALEQREKKLAFLQTTEVKDRADDFSRGAAVTIVEPLEKLEVDRALWQKEARRLSAVFRNYPGVLVSSVTFNAEAKNRWFLNSEGSSVRTGSAEYRLIAMAGSQATDGTKFFDFEVLAGGEKPAKPESLEKSVRALAERLTKLTEAPLATRYRGPVLFEGPAAAQLVFETLGYHAGAPRDQLGPRGRRASSYPMRDELGRRVMPAFISVTDDPTLRELHGVPVFGGFEIDDEGVPAQKIALVERGVLKTFCMSRAPTRDQKTSNGHSRYGWGAASTLVVSTEQPTSLAELKKQLIQLGKKEELSEVYIVRKMAGAAMAGFAPWAYGWSMRSSARRSSEVSLSAPVLLYRVSVRDGSETLVRGAAFGGHSLRILRDIEATGDDARPHPIAYGSELRSLVTPSLLVEEVELETSSDESDKPPFLPHPYFEKR